MPNADDFKLKMITYQEERANFFREQFISANRKFEWAVKNQADPWKIAEKAEHVNFMEWAWKQAQKEVEDLESEQI